MSSTLPGLCLPSPQPRWRTCPCTSNRYRPASLDCMPPKLEGSVATSADSQLILGCPSLPLLSRAKAQGLPPHCPPVPHGARLCFPGGQDLKRPHLVLFVLSVDHGSHTPQHRGLRAERAAYDAPGSPI